MTHTEKDDSHYTAENTRNGVHACTDAACLTAGVSMADLNHLSYALTALEETFDGTGVKTATFRDDTGLYVLLTVPFGDGRAVVGAVYTPGLLADLRDKGYTLSYEEATSVPN